MIRLTLLSALLCTSSVAIGCQCIKSIGSNFLNQVTNFDLIVLGTFHLGTETDQITLEVERIYKGKASTKAIELIRGGVDCNHLLSFEEGQRNGITATGSLWSIISNSNIIYATTVTGVFYSTDTGETWIKLPNKDDFFDQVFRLGSNENYIFGVDQYNAYRISRVK
jgi:hypothetical protein